MPLVAGLLEAFRTEGLGGILEGDVEASDPAPSRGGSESDCSASCTEAGGRSIAVVTATSRSTSSPFELTGAPRRSISVSSMPVRALPPSASPMAVIARLERPMAMTCQTALAGIRCTIVMRLSAVAAMPPFTPITIENWSGSASRPFLCSASASSRWPVS